MCDLPDLLWSIFVRFHSFNARNILRSRFKCRIHIHTYIYTHTHDRSSYVASWLAIDLVFIHIARFVAENRKNPSSFHVTDCGGTSSSFSSSSSNRMSSVAPISGFGSLKQALWRAPIVVGCLCTSRLFISAGTKIRRKKCIKLVPTLPPPVCRNARPVSVSGTCIKIPLQNVSNVMYKMQSSTLL